MALEPAQPVPEAEQLLRRLEWTVIRRLDGLLQGDYRTLFRGAGVDLADLREYQHHDDVRHIDWNVTARLQAPYVRQFIEDRDLTAWFLLDLSGSVDFGSAGVSKLAVSTAFVATLARVITRHGNRVGAVFYGRQAAGKTGRQVDAVLPPGATRRHVLNLLQRMRTPPVDGAQAPPATSTRLADLLGAADTVMKRRALVFVLSDFISAPGWQAALARLARRHEVVAVRLFDPLELALPDDADLGLVTLQDAETSEQIFVDASDPNFRARYTDIAQAQEETLLNELARSGADVLELATDDDLLQALIRYADLRRQRSRGRSGARWPAALRRAQPLQVAPTPAGASA